MSELTAAVERSLEAQRPLLHHLNADTSWLLQIPLNGNRRSNGRHFFNILIDPWLSGSQSDVASWFSQQWHASECAVPSINALEELCREVETLAANTYQDANNVREINTLEDAETLIGAILISHEFTDHCHKQTLLECPRQIPVIATKKAADLIRKWKHFTTVTETPGFAGISSDWRTLSIATLPSWLSISRVITKSDALYYHSAILIAWNANSSSDGMDADALIYTPHGIHAADLTSVAAAQPSINTLAILHGLHDVSLWQQQLNLGAHNGLEAQRLLKARYWVGTHDEVKKAGGLVGLFLKRKVITIQDALEEARRREVSGGVGDGEAAFKDVKYVDLMNGGRLVLA